MRLASRFSKRLSRCCSMCLSMSMKVTKYERSGSRLDSLGVGDVFHRQPSGRREKWGGGGRGGDLRLCFQASVVLRLSLLSGVYSADVRLRLKSQRRRLVASPLQQDPLHSIRLSDVRKDMDYITCRCDSCYAQGGRGFASRLVWKWFSRILYGASTRMLHGPDVRL